LSSLSLHDLYLTTSNPLCFSLTSPEPYSSLPKGLRPLLPPYALCSPLTPMACSPWVFIFIFYLCLCLLKQAKAKDNKNNNKGSQFLFLFFLCFCLKTKEKDIRIKIRKARVEQRVRGFDLFLYPSSLAPLACSPWVFIIIFYLCFCLLCF